MANRNYTKTITLPKWIQEITPRPEKYLKSLFKTMAFLKMKEYQKQIQPYQEKYRFSFNQFEKKVKSQKKENFEIWDDYLVWKGLHQAYQKWLKRYHEL